MNAVTSGDKSNGIKAEKMRNEKIKSQKLKYEPVAWDDLYLLSKIIYAEAGSSFLSDSWKISVGEVVLNRVTSPEFPDTLSDVIYQPGQYYNTKSNYFKNLKPNIDYVDIAKRLLEGERILNNPSVVFQANFKQGSGVYKSYYNEYLGWTYFCYSNHPELYKSEENKWDVRQK